MLEDIKKHSGPPPTSCAELGARMSNPADEYCYAGASADDLAAELEDRDY